MHHLNVAHNSRVCRVVKKTDIAIRVFLSPTLHCRHMSAALVVRRPSSTVGVGTAIGKYSRRSIGITGMLM